MCVYIYIYIYSSELVGVRQNIGDYEPAEKNKE